MDWVNARVETLLTKLGKLREEICLEKCLRKLVRDRNVHWKVMCIREKVNIKTAKMSLPAL